MAKLNSLATRVISGAVFVIMMVGALLLSRFSFAALVLVIGIGSLWEFFGLAQRTGACPQKWYAVVLGSAAILSAFFAACGYIQPLSIVIGFIPLLAVMFFVELYRKKTNPMYNISVTLGGLFYAVLPMMLLCGIAFQTGTYDPYPVLAYIAIVWMNDVFAYFSGMLLGVYKLFPRISPNKTWEGFFGGVVFAIAFAALCGYLLGGNLWTWAGLGALVALTAVLGDLAESMFKREAGVKDSGNIMPGHGGFMDRFDALLLSVPLVFLYFIIFM